MTPARPWAGYRPEVATDLRVRYGRHAVNALAACFAAGALVEDLISPTVTLAAGRYDRGPEVVIAAVLAGAVTLVALRDRLGVVAPLSAVALFGLASLAAPAWVLDSAFVYLLVMLACGVGGYVARSRLSHGAGLLVLWVVGSLAAWRHSDPSWGQWAGVIIFMSIAWVAGTIVRGPVVRARSAEERAAHLELDQAEAARLAVIDERARIARELHDIIAHSVSVMTVQAGAVRRRLTSDQTRERDSLVAVERTGREALAEMRRLVGMLHEEEIASYAPQPGLLALDTLITTVRAAGLPVDLQVEGARRELPPGVDLAAYRVVQEALTNTLKHAGPARASVQICWTDDELRIEVANDGRNIAPSTGYGHAGMRERMRLYGGHLESGPRANGGYLVRAYLPIGSKG
jgi:signal transduction histidine kinase